MRRLIEAGRREEHWRRWGPYLSERAWGTVREDYSASARVGVLPPRSVARRAYRWGEDGSARHLRRPASGSASRSRCGTAATRFSRSGSSASPARGQPRRGRQGVLLLSRLHADALLHEGLYKYPQAEFPYAAAGRRERAARDASEPEFELLDTGVFEDDRYFDVFVEYAKAMPNDILIRITVDESRAGCGARSTCCRQLWFRNTWAWGPASGRAATAVRRATTGM